MRCGYLPPCFCVTAVILTDPVLSSVLLPVVSMDKYICIYSTYLVGDAAKFGRRWPTESSSCFLLCCETSGTVKKKTNK